MGAQYINLSNSPSALLATSQGVAAQVINRVVYLDNPQINQNLQAVNVLSSIAEVLRQMIAQNATVLRLTVASTNSSFVGVGNGIIVSSVKRFDGLPQENLFAETLTLVCTTDSYSGTATAGNEGFSVTGQGSQSNLAAFDWPLGSNTQGSLNAIDGNSDNSNGNILTNSGFEDWTSNVPDNWTLQTGTAGVDIFEEGGLNYDGVASLRFLGDGVTLTEIRQAFDDGDDGTSATLSPLSQYPFNIFARRDGLAPAAGVLTIDLYDVDTGLIVQDEQGTNNSFTIDCTGLTTDYLSYTGFFRTPQILGDDIRIRIRFTTALTTGRSIYLDKSALGDDISSLYVGGPSVSVFAGSVPFAQGDRGTFTVTNSRGAGGTLNTWQTAWYRLFPEVQTNNLMLPSGNSPTIADSLLT